MRKHDTFTDLNALAELCLNIANIIDRRAEENGKGDYDIDELGMGYRAADYYLRQGVKAIVDIQNMYAYEKEKADLAKISEQVANDFVKDIFGDEEVTSINDKDKERIRQFVQDIYKEWEDEDEDE